MIDIQGLYDSLLDASFRGVSFSIIDTRLDVGRRMQREMFPGLDTSLFQDLGAMDGPIRITGLISGDDFVAQARKLRLAFRTAGPGTLLHPWIDDSIVILQGPASISFKDTELRIARFEASFIRYDPYEPPGPDTLQGLLDAISDLKTQARAWLRGVLAPLVLPLAVFGFAVGFIGRVATTWQELTQGGLGLDILGAAAAPLIGLLGSNSQSYGPGWADATVAALAAVPDAIAAASVPTPPAAVGAGGSTATPPAADPRDAVTLLLAAAAQVGAGVAAVTPGPALVATTQAIILADAVAAASDIAYTSQQDAIQWRDRIVAALDTSVALTANLAAADPANAAPSWRALSAVRTAFLVDINGEIGRLPPVVTIQIPNTVPAWLVAQFWADGVPGEVRTAYLDIVARNRVRNPALVPAGAIEVLA